MEFELKNIEVNGSVHTEDNDPTNSVIWINISVGVKGNPNKNMVETTTVKYVFSKLSTVKDAEDGMIIFANTWALTNYPSI